MPQYYKGDANELKMDAAAAEVFDQLGSALDEFDTDAYNCQSLGSVLFDTNRTPLSNAIPRQIFRESFNDIFTAFQSAGTFEAYLSVFQKIFGDDVDVTFTVPAPGKLEIDIIADTVLFYNFIARRIFENEYFFDNVIYEDGDGTGNIVFQTVKGFQSQYELEQMLFEMVPAGVFTDIDLTLG